MKKDEEDEKKQVHMPITCVPCIIIKLLVNCILKIEINLLSLNYEQ